MFNVKKIAPRSSGENTVSSKKNTREKRRYRAIAARY